MHRDMHKTSMPLYGTIRKMKYIFRVEQFDLTVTSIKNKGTGSLFESSFVIP